jgi:glycine/D-amino acid oxidase-like deaminating enzyme
VSLGQPFWWDDAPPQSRTGALPSSVDVLIIGGGFTGLSAALTLARKGRSVLVCEGEAFGYGASGRNGGHVGAKLITRCSM